MSHKSLMGFERIASRATVEPPLQVDVVESVLKTLQSRSVTREVERDYLLFSGVSVLAASLAMAVFWHGTVDDSLLPLIQPFVTVLP